MDGVQKNYNIRELVRNQFCSNENVEYLHSVINDNLQNDDIKKLISSNMPGYVRNFNRRFGTSESVYSSLTDVSTLKTDDAMLWDGVRKLNNMFLSLILDKYVEDFKSENIGRYGYLESMFVATDLRPCGYENLNNSDIQSFVLNTDEKRKCSDDILKLDPYNRFHAAFMNTQASDMNRTEINGNDSRMPYYNEHYDGVEWFMKQKQDDELPQAKEKFGITPRRFYADSIKSPLNTKSNNTPKQIYVNKNVYPELLTPTVRRTYPGENKGFAQKIEVESSDDVISYDIEGTPSYPGGQSAFSRDVYNAMTPVDRELADREDILTNRTSHGYANVLENKDKFMPWQNLSKRNIHRIEGYEQDDQLDLTVSEKNNHPSGGEYNARGNKHLTKGYGDGYRWKGVPLGTGVRDTRMLTRPENFLTRNDTEYNLPGTVPHRYRDDENTQYNKEFGFKLFKQDLSAMHDYPQRYNRTERTLINGMDNKSHAPHCDDC
jgi:hypothetical protein